MKNTEIINMIQAQSTYYEDSLETSVDKFLGRKDIDIEKLKHIGFFVITPDSIKRELVTPILDFVIENTNAKILSAKLKYLSSHDIENLYKYTFRKRIIDGEQTFWWLMQRSFQLDPCIAVIMFCDEHKEETFCDTLLNLKGSFVKNCMPVVETIRDHFTSISRILAVIHSSDDIYSMLREALLFFTIQEITSIIKFEKYLTKNSVSCLVEGYNEHDLSMIKEYLLKRIYATIFFNNQVTIKERFDKNISDKQFIKIVNSCLNELDINLVKVIKGIYERNYDISIEYYGEILRHADIYINHWEEVVLINQLFFNK